MFIAIKFDAQKSDPKTVAEILCEILEENSIFQTIKQSNWNTKFQMEFQLMSAQT